MTRTVPEEPKKRPRCLTAIFRALTLGCAAAAPLAAQTPRHARATGDDAGDWLAWVAALREGSGPSLGRAQRGFAKTGPGADAALPALTLLLRDSRPSVRAHAAAALASLGSAARGVVPSLAAALADSSAQVRAEAAWALGLIGWESGPPTLAPATALLDLVTDPSPLVAARALDAAARLGVPGELVSRLDALLVDTVPARRAIGMRLLSRLTDRPLAAARLDALLHSPDRQTRAAATWGVAELADLASATLPRLDSLRGDPDPGVREAAEYAAERLRRPRRSTPSSRDVAAAVACQHRVIDGSIPMTLTVLPGAASLRGDGRGPYRQADGTRSSLFYSYNLLLPAADGTMSEYRRTATDTARAPVRTPARTLSLDLSAPVAGTAARALGVVHDSAARIHTFHMIDVHRMVWSLRDVPVGAEVVSDRTEVHITIDGAPHILHFGPWALGECSEPQMRGGVLHGAGTTPVRIQRLSEREFVVEASAGAAGRLWGVSDPSEPIDRGLYRVAFRARLDQEP